jgi:hypothetical protein
MPLAVVSREAAEPATESMPAAQTVSRVADPGAAAVAAGVATPDGNGSVVFRTPIELDGFGSYPEAGPSVQRQEAAGESVSPGMPEPNQSDELERLSVKLEERLFRRLRQQLWLLRERKGKLADL